MHISEKEGKYKSCGRALASVMIIAFILWALRENLFKSCLYIYFQF